MTKSLIPCWKAERSHLCKHLLQTRHFQLHVCKGKRENHRAVGRGTEQRLSSLLFPLAPWTWRPAESESHSPSEGSTAATQSSLNCWMALLRALKKQTMSISSRKVILVPPGSSDSHCRELSGNSEIHRLFQSPFITAHNDTQAVPEAIQLDFSSASLVLSHVLLGTPVLHMCLWKCSLSKQLLFMWMKEKTR